MFQAASWAKLGADTAACRNIDFQGGRLQDWRPGASTSLARQPTIHQQFAEVGRERENRS